MAAVNWKSEKIARRYVGGATNTQDPTGTTPGTAEARYVAANALAASMDPAMWTLFPPRSAPPPAGSLNHRWHAPLLLRCLRTKIFHARNFDLTVLDRLSADIVGGSDHTECNPEHPSGRRNTYRQEERASVRRVLPTDGGLVPSQTYEYLGACADNTAVLSLNRANPERVSYEPAEW